MRRREFITLIGGVAAMPLAAGAQQTERVRRFGVLMSTAADDPVGQARIAAFRQGLQKLGWTEGQNVRIDIRWAGGNADLDRKFAGGIGRAYAGCCFGHGEPDCGGFARCEPHRANRVRARCRSGGRRLRR